MQYFKVINNCIVEIRVNLSMRMLSYNQQVFVFKHDILQ